MPGRSHPSQNDNQLTAGCVRVLEQGLALVERLDDELYSGAGNLPVQSGVGGHFRHCTDFFESFLAGARSGRVDYERRGRDPLAARDRAFAATKLRIIISELRTLPLADGDAPLMVGLEDESDKSDELHASPDSTRWCVSTVSRELQFLLSHTVHHHALVALVLRLRGFEPGEEFGVAPSTLRHWRSKAVAHEERNPDDASAHEDAVSQGSAGAREDVDVHGLSNVLEGEAACAL